MPSFSPFLTRLFPLFSFTSVSSLLRSSLRVAPLFPNKNTKDLSQITAGQQKVSSQDDTMFRSLPASWASTQPTAQQKKPRWSQRAASRLPSSQPTVLKPCFYSFPSSLIEATLRAAAALLSLPVAPMLPVWLLFLSPVTDFPRLCLLNPWTLDAAVGG